jgi:hypothetical protein
LEPHSGITHTSIGTTEQTEDYNGSHGDAELLIFDDPIPAVEGLIKGEYDFRTVQVSVTGSTGSLQKGGDFAGHVSLRSSPLLWPK